jgi:hypothetical protein
MDFEAAAITLDNGCLMVELLQRRWLEYLGLSLKDVQGWGWTPAIHPEDVASFLG